MIRIVIVDDHEMLREGLKAILAPERDFEVVGESGSADNLLELVQRSQPDIVLLDARLPGRVSGPEACRRITETHPEAKVIVVSTFSDDALVGACIDAGAKGYVIKDIERFDLKRSIRAVQGGEAVIDKAVARRVLERARGTESTARPADPPLNPSQLEILRLVAEGFSNREIAARVHLSENTVKFHLKEIFQKLQVRNRVEAALRATKAGWV
jgi:DNA-binding NarL/FixJ family response regulator